MNECLSLLDIILSYSRAWSVSWKIWQSWVSAENERRGARAQQHWLWWHLQILLAVLALYAILQIQFIFCLFVFGWKFMCLLALDNLLDFSFTKFCKLAQFFARISLEEWKMLIQFLKRYESGTFQFSISKTYPRLHSWIFVPN